MVLPAAGACRRGIPGHFVAALADWAYWPYNVHDPSTMANAALTRLAWATRFAPGLAAGSSMTGPLAPADRACLDRAGVAVSAEVRLFSSRRLRDRSDPPALSTLATGLECESVTASANRANASSRHDALFVSAKRAFLQPSWSARLAQWLAVCSTSSNPEHTVTVRALRTVLSAVTRPAQNTLRSPSHDRPELLAAATDIRESAPVTTAAHTTALHSMWARDNALAVQAARLADTAHTAVDKQPGQAAKRQGRI